MCSARFLNIKRTSLLFGAFAITPLIIVLHWLCSDGFNLRIDRLQRKSVEISIKMNFYKNKTNM